MFENITKRRAYAYLTGIFCASVIVSNILATRTLEFEFIALPCSILTFPVLFIVNDILSEIYGYKLTRDVVYLGFIINIIAIVLYHVAMAFPSSSQNVHAFAMILSTTPRLLLQGSFHIRWEICWIQKFWLSWRKNTMTSYLYVAYSALQ